MKYKPWRDKTKDEKEQDHWEKRGRPRIIWHSKIQGTYVRAQHGPIGIRDSEEAKCDN